VTGDLSWTGVRRHDDKSTVARPTSYGTCNGPRSVCTARTGRAIATPRARTITVDVTKPNGSVQTIRTTTLADIYASLPVAA
jgi:hypothetical protein